MVKNYFLVALRVMTRKLKFSIINIAGLSIGLACSLLIFLWVVDEYSFDRYHEKIDRIYSLGQDQFYGVDTFSFYAMPGPLKATIDEYPEIEKSTREQFMNATLINGEKVFDEKSCLIDPDFFDIFDVPFIEKLEESPLVDRNSIVLSEESARKFFKGQNPLGKPIQIRTPAGTRELTITAIIEKMPNNTRFKVDAFMHFELLKDFGQNYETSWNNSYRMDILTSENVSLPKLNERLEKTLQEPADTDAVLFAHPYKDRYLYGLRYKGTAIFYVYIFGSIAVFILIIACINFMNLTTARSIQRAKEIGVRKTVGGSKTQIIIQFFGESILFAFISLNIALILVEILRPSFNILSGKTLFVPYFDPSFILSILLIAILTGVLSGVYPALFMSSFKPTEVLKGGKIKASGNVVRRFLVTFQFILSGTLIVGILVISVQMNFIKNKDIGIEKENLIYFKTGTLELKKELARRIEALPQVKSVSFTSSVPSAIGNNGGGWNWLGKNPDDEVLISFLGTDYNFTKTFDSEIVAGRFFEENISGDTIDNLIINESLANMVDPNNAVGKTLVRGEKRYNIIGVIRNFNFRPLTTEIGPAIIYSQKEGQFLFVRYETKTPSVLINQIESINRNLHPDSPIELTFLSESVNNMYRAQSRMSDLVLYFGVLALIISCLGLYGLSLYVAERRRKEIGIRKAMGSTSLALIILIIRDFVVLVVIAGVISCTAGYFIMDNWLNEFHYRVSIPVWIYPLTILILIVIAVVTVFIEAKKAAGTDPVKVLRYE